MILFQFLALICKFSTINRVISFTRLVSKQIINFWFVPCFENKFSLLIKSPVDLYNSTVKSEKLKMLKLDEI